MSCNNIFDSVADFLLEVRRRWNPGKPTELALGKAWLSITYQGALPSTDLLRLDKTLTPFSAARELKDFLFASKGIRS